MAADAKAILSHPGQAVFQLTDVVEALRRSVPFAALGLCAFAYAGLLLGDLRLFDNDYDWINTAQDTGWLGVLGEILRPIPERWGFQDRPVQTLVFKLLHSFAGEQPGVYYAFKAGLFAGVSVAISWFARRLGSDALAAILAGAIFAISSPGHASALWISDFELMAEILILLALGQFWRILKSTPTSRMEEWLNQALFVLLALVSHRTKGSAKLIPAIVLIYLVLYRRDQIRRFIPSLALIGLTIVPIFSMISDPLPPFAPFAEDQSQGWMWKPANLATLGTLLIGNFHPISGTSGPGIAFGLLAVLTPGLLWITALGVAYFVWKNGKSFFSDEVGLIAIWLLVSVLSYASFPRLPEGFMARYVVVALVPASLLVAHILSGSLLRLPRMAAIGVLAVCLTIHAAHNLDSSRHLRDTLGQVIVAYDLAREHIATRLSDEDVLIIGFDYGYNRRLGDTNTYHRGQIQIRDIDETNRLHVLVRSDQDLDNVEHQSAVQDIQNAIKLPPVSRGMRVKVRPVETFAGLTDSFYDTNIYESRQSFVGLLYEVTFEREQS